MNSTFSGSSNVQTLASSGQTVVLGSMLGGYAPNGTGSARTITSNINFSLNLSELDLKDALQIGLANPTSQGDGFDTLVFQIFRQAVLVESQTFTNLASATAYFTDHVINLGTNQGITGQLDLRFSLSVTSSTVGDSFGFDVATVAIPEPSIIWLVLLSLAVLFVWRRWLERSVRTITQ